MQLEINKRKAGKFTSMWKLNNTLLKSQEVKEEIKRKTSENGNTTEYRPEK